MGTPRKKATLGRLLTLLALFLVACGGPSFSMGSTHVFVYEGAEPWCDLPEVLMCYGAIMNEVAKDDDVMNVAIEILPGWMPIISPGHGLQFGARSVFEPPFNVIRVRAIGLSVYGSGLAHELFQHKLPHFLSNGEEVNRKHEHQWKIIHQAAVAACQEKVRTCNTQ